MQSKEELVGSFLRGLNKKQIIYSVLRDYEQLVSQNEIDHDVDLYVNPKDLMIFEDNMILFFENNNARVVKIINKYDFCAYLIEMKIGSSYEYLKMDVWISFNWRGLRWFDNKDIEKNIIDINGIYVSDATTALAIRMLKDLIFTSRLPERSLQRVENEFINIQKTDKLLDFKNLFVSDKVSNTIEQYLQSKSYSSLSENSRFIRWSQIKQLCKSPLDIVKNIYYFIFFCWDLVTSLFVPIGKNVVLIGPDGSGKSTLAKKIQRDFGSKLFNGCDVNYSRPGVLPPINKIFNFFKKENKKPKVYDLNTDDKVSSIKGSIQIVYYSLDFLFGSISIFIRKSRGRLIIYDRYFYDYFIQTYWDNVNEKLKYLCMSLVPKPNHVVFLKASPGAIVARKPELKINVIKDQQNRIAGLKLTKKISIVDTELDIDSTVSSIYRLIFEELYVNTNKFNR